MSQWTEKQVTAVQLQCSYPWHEYPSVAAHKIGITFLLAGVLFIVTVKSTFPVKHRNV